MEHMGPREKSTLKPDGMTEFHPLLTDRLARAESVPSLPFLLLSRGVMPMPTHGVTVRIKRGGISKGLRTIPDMWYGISKYWPLLCVST